MFLRLIALIYVLNLSCLVRASSNIDPNVFYNKIQVRSKEIKKFVDEFRKSEKYQKAWGLFSYGGWADKGQFWVFAEKEFPSVVFYSSYQYSRSVYQDGKMKYKRHFVSSQHSKNFFTFFSRNFNLLKDFHVKSFDAIKYQVVVLEKSSNKNYILYKKIIYFDDPSLKPKQSSGYSKIIKMFNGLIEK
jgi:hypothetical protein